MSTVVFNDFDEPYQELRTRLWRIAIRTNCCIITKFSIDNKHLGKGPAHPVQTGSTDMKDRDNFPENLPRVLTPSSE